VRVPVQATVGIFCSAHTPPAYLDTQVLFALLADWDGELLERVEGCAGGRQIIHKRAHRIGHQADALQLGRVCHACSLNGADLSAQS